MWKIHKWPLPCYAMAGDSGNAGGNSQQTSQIPNSGDRPNNENNDQGDNKSDDKNNEENKLAHLKTLWQNDEDEDKDNKSGSDNNQPTNTPTIDPDKQLQDHLKSLKLTDGLDLDDIRDRLRQGDNKAIEDLTTHIGQKAYLASIGNMNKIIDQRVQEAVADAVKQSAQQTDMRLAITTMNKELPFTTDPLIDPIAKAALSQGIKKTGNMNDAIKMVSDVFGVMGEIVGGKKKTKNINGNVNSIPSGDDGDEESDFGEIDFTEVLTESRRR